MANMKIRVLSDLHIEFHPFRIPPAAHDAETVLVLAGDIGVIHRRSELEGFLRAAAQQFRAIVYVLGNHEYYRGQWPQALDVLRSWPLPANVHVLERQTVQIDGIVFVGTTLWSDFEGGNQEVMRAAGQAMNDFHYIRRPGNAGNDDDDGARALTPGDVLEDHYRSRAWLQATLEDLHRRGQRCVVVTHHGVSLQSVHADYEGNAFNGAFVSDCEALFRQAAPELIVHGHVHNSFDYPLATARGSCRVVVNPRGYTRRDDTQENPLFDPGLTIELQGNDDD